ncbi:MAG: OmpA family protein [Luteolibacter sp.]
MKSKLPYFFLGLAAVLAIAAVVILIVKPGVPKAPLATTEPDELVKETPLEEIEGVNDPLPPGSTETSVPGSAARISANPAELLESIGEAMEKGDLDTFSQLIGKDALDEEKLKRLGEMARAGSLRLRKPGGVREIGELELNKRARWAIELDGQEEGRDKIIFELQNEDGKWKVDDLVLPPAPGQPVPKAMVADSLGVSDAFLQAVLDQNFEFALDFIDKEKVSETKIAALCILFEEGEYKMREQKPLRAMFSRENMVGYIANVVAKGGGNGAQFGMNLRRSDGGGNWEVTEINLDSLLADYASRVAGGDVYYSPLVKNPSGGETLALYFEFDQDEMNDRTRRQLEIVATLLKSDPTKKITLSGHTDALGSEDYNDKLSGNRAQSVRDFLAAAGVSPDQIITIAKGASQPRRPNVTETGEDDPNGRRANRRTEIYLDF